MKSYLAINIIDGYNLAKEVKFELQKEIENLKKKGVIPSLAIILVGENKASLIYVKAKIRECQKIGILASLYKFDENVSQEEVLNKIDECNRDSLCHGILVQLPLPPHISYSKVFERISPSKDVDGLNPYNIGRLVLGKSGFIPCTPLGILQMLLKKGVALVGKNVVVVGRSLIVGKPLSILLQHYDATVTLCHSKTKNLKFYTKEADILVVAVGIPSFIGKEDVKKGVIVIDVGINRVDSKIVGDVNFEEVSSLAALISPVPKGVGPMTIAMLLKNVVKAAKVV